ncbi:MAG: RNA polymerase subunit sigma-24 [Phycisphaeraceae bacterium]|nr:RNA polymerase subunit sigma-24 [Phycisphaeraceae bacterium]
MEPTSDATCWTLIRGAAAGRSDDRSVFGRRYAEPVRAFFAARWRFSVNRQEVEDALQEVFLECFRRGGVLDRVDADRPGGFRAFLYGVCRNVAMRTESGRKKARDRGIDDLRVDLDRVECDETSLSRAFDRGWAKTIVREAAQRHEELARAAGREHLQRLELLRMRFGDGLPVREIAARLGKEDKDAIHRELRRARLEFRNALQEIVAYHQPTASAGDVERECERLQALLD